MSRPALVEIQQADLDTMRVQRQHLLALRYLYDLPFGQGVSIIADQSLGTTPVDVAHGLGRLPVGWLIVKQNNGGVVYAPSASSDTSLSMAASAPIVVTLMFF
jgi:hypothetical protein